MILQEMAKAGQLSKLTRVPLNEYCDRHRLNKSGRKDVIVERIMEHLGF